MDVQLFTAAEGFAVRTIMKSGDPWFVVADVLRTLDIDRSSLERLDEDEKGVDSINTPGGIQSMTIVSEAGLYSLVLGSRKPEAKPFKRWVTHEVLPAIRKTGGYSVGIPRNLPEALRLAADLAEKLEAAQPAVEFVERYVEAENTKGLREVAKVLGIPPVKFSTWLVSAGILFRQGQKLLPYSEHMDKGRFEVKTGEKHGHAFHQTRFTPDGIAWIAKRAKECA